MLDRCYRDGLGVGYPLQRSLAHPSDNGVSYVVLE